MITAAVLIIGDEILSGRTQDVNLSYIANKFQESGIILKECRIVPDQIESIVFAVNDVREKYTYIFTTGGIGGTHDDITYESIAKALNIPLEMHKEALKELTEKYNEKLNNARSRMALAPKGAILHKNMFFQISNIFMLAGIPKIMREMFDTAFAILEKGKVIQSISIIINQPENDIADRLRELQKQWPKISIGSYPFEENGNYGVTIVARSAQHEDLMTIKPLIEQLAD